MTTDYSPWSEREIWPFLKGAKSQKPKMPYPPKIGAHAYLIILKVFVCFSMFTYPSLFTYCFESLNAYHNVLILLLKRACNLEQNEIINLLSNLLWLYLCQLVRGWIDTHETGRPHLINCKCHCSGDRRYFFKIIKLFSLKGPATLWSHLLATCDLFMDTLFFRL